MASISREDNIWAGQFYENWARATENPGEAFYFAQVAVRFYADARYVEGIRRLKTEVLPEIRESIQLEFKHIITARGLNCTPDNLEILFREHSPSSGRIKGISDAYRMLLEGE